MSGKSRFGPLPENEALALALYRARKDGRSLDDFLPGLGTLHSRAMAMLPGKKPMVAAEVVVALMDLYALDQVLEGR